MTDLPSIKPPQPDTPPSASLPPDSPSISDSHQNEKITNVGLDNLPSAGSNKKNKIILAALGMLFLLLSTPLAVYLIKQRQEIRKEAAEKPPATHATPTPSAQIVYIYPYNLSLDATQSDCKKASGTCYNTQGNKVSCEDKFTGSVEKTYKTLQIFENRPYYAPFRRMRFMAGQKNDPCCSGARYERTYIGTAGIGAVSSKRAGQTFEIPPGITKIKGFPL